MDMNKEHRAGARALWAVQGLAIAALCVGPGIASANAYLTAHYGDTQRPGGGTSGGTSGDTTNPPTNPPSNPPTNQYTPQTQSLTLDTSTPNTDGDGPPNGNTQLPDPPPPQDVPEPGSLALILAGFAGLAFAETRRRSRGCKASNGLR